jgi:hypothetical protein
VASGCGTVDIKFDVKTEKSLQRLT